MRAAQSNDGVTLYEQNCPSGFDDHLVDVTSRGAEGMDGCNSSQDICPPPWDQTILLVSWGTSYIVGTQLCSTN